MTNKDYIESVVNQANEKIRSKELTYEEAIGWIFEQFGFNELKQSVINEILESTLEKIV